MTSARIIPFISYDGYVVYCFDTHRYRRCYIHFQDRFRRTSTCCLSRKRKKEDRFNYKQAAHKRYL